MITYPRIIVETLSNVKSAPRCPGHTIHSGYAEYVEKALKLAGRVRIGKEEVRKYESWSPYRV